MHYLPGVGLTVVAKIDEFLGRTACSLEDTPMNLKLLTNNYHLHDGDKKLFMH